MAAYGHVAANVSDALSTVEWLKQAVEDCDFIKENCEQMPVVLSQVHTTLKCIGGAIHSVGLNDAVRVSPPCTISKISRAGKIAH